MSSSAVDLHIVAQPKDVPTRKRKKKFNKYDRRRAKQKKTEVTPSSKPIDCESNDDGTEKQSEVPSSLNTSTIEISEDINRKPLTSDGASAPQRKPPILSADHAAYLAEFHARPMELDRRAGVVKKNSTPQSQSSSTHLHNHESWTDFELHDRILHALSKMGMKQPTRIQSASLLNKDDNILLHSETGSGKTLAYLLPIMQELATKYSDTSACRRTLGTVSLIVCPTRELARQTLEICQSICQASFHWLVAGSLCDESRKSEKQKIRRGIGILVATPGRLLDHLQKTESLLVSLKQLQWFVLDEADRLLDMGLGAQMEQIVQHLRANKATTSWKCRLVSATVTPQVQDLATTILKNASWSWIRATNEATDSAARQATPRQLQHYHVTVSAKLRLATLTAFLLSRKKERILVFMSTCASVDYHYALFEALGEFPVGRLHGNLTPAQRHAVLRDGGKILLCTDVAARGLNLALDWTVQYDPPSELADYWHRAGRVARAGAPGQSLLFLLPSERPFVELLNVTMTPLSLAIILNKAAEVSGIRGSDRGSRAGEAFSSELQRRVEACLAASPEDKDEASLLELAQVAFFAHIRAYPTKEKLIRHLFASKSLHLGHVARSFGLREAPKKLQQKRKKNDKKKIEKHEKVDVGKNRSMLMANALKLQHDNL